MEVAENLMEKGCLWNSFVMIGTARAFLNLIRKAAPAVFASLRLPTASDPEHDAISSVYAEVPNVDFSGSILAACPHCCQQSEQDIHFVLGADHESDAKGPAGRLQTEIGESDATRALDPDSFFAYRRP